MKKPRQFKPIYELDRLSEAERDQLWADLNQGLSYDRALRILGKEHFAPIKRHRLYTWWHREDLRRQLNASLPAASRLAAAEFLQLLNGQTLPWSELMQARILRAAFLLTDEAEEQTPSKLATLQRIANNEFNQEMARERLDLEKRRVALREKQAGEKEKSGEITDRTDKREGAEDGTNREKEEPFRLWTKQEIEINQPLVLEAMRKNPLLRQMLEPDEEPAAPEEKAHHEEHQEHEGERISSP